MVRGAAEGRMPSWLAATYNDANSEPDLERLWADVKGISASKSRAATVFQLRNEFGGYCDRRKATESAFENGVTRNPWRDGGCVPAAPRDVSATAVGGGKLTVSWDPPDDDGGSPIEGYKVQWKSGTEAYDSSRQAEVTDLEPLSHTIESLTSGVDHSVRVVAYNHNGGGADSVETTATAGAQDMTAPQLSAATADGASLVLTWNETLDETSVPLPGAFEVSVGGTARGIGGVSVTDDRVTLTLTSAVAVGEAVTLSYAVPAGANASPLRDTAMTAAAGLSGHEVRNDTTAVTIVSDPGADVTYIFHYGYTSQDVIELTVTFSERVTVTGVPELALQVGTVTKQAAYAGGSGTTALTFRYVVADGDTDADGVSVLAGRIGDKGGTVQYLASNDAAPARVSLAAQPGHKVDGVRPALVSVRAVANGNVLTLTWDKVLDENSVPGWGDNRGFQLWDLVDGWDTPGPPRDEITAVSISGAVVTLDLSSTVQSGDQLVVSYTVPYKDYPPLLDTLGNYAGNNKVEISIAASESSNTPPTGLPAISGTAQVGDTLTGSADEIVDADGLQNAEFAWQWLTNDGTADVDIAGATAATYTLTAADLGKTIKVRVSFTDDGGTEETLVSAATVAVAETQPPVPEITFGGGFTVDEGETKVATLTMQETEERRSDPVWSIPKGTDGGEDADAFTLEPGGVLSFRTAKDYESPDDADGDGEYEVTVQFGTKTANESADLVISLRNVNEAPVADAGADIAGVSPGANVTLDGSGSSDPDMDDTLTWLWTQTDASGYPVVLSDAAAKRPTFTMPSDIAADAVLVFTLRVTDAGGLFAEDSVRVSVAPTPTVSIRQADSAYAREGEDAIFTLTRTGGIDDALTLAVTVTETGNMLGTPVPSEAAFEAGDREATLRVPSADDGAQEANSVVTARIGTGAGYRIATDAGVATVTVLDDDAPAGTTVAPTEVLWSADVEVTDFGGAFGAMTSDSFSNVAGSGDLGVVRIWYSVGARRLDLVLSEAVRDAGELTLHLDDVALAFPQGSSGKSSIRWRRTRLSWKNGQTVAVRLTRASQTQAATSAELRSLAVSGATLSPAFDPAVLVYAAEVDRGASSVTVSAGASDSAATVAIEPSEDADAESPDHQVAVPFGETLITVSVTAADEATRREYRVVANRPARPVNVSFGAAAYAATEGGTPAAVTVLLSADPERAITVPLTATPADGADGQDYSVPNSVSFASGDALSQTITVAAADDEVEEDGESVVLGFGILPPGVTAGETKEATVALSDGAPSEPVNVPPTGLPTIAGTARVGETLTASETGIDDANGLTGVAFAWQWVSNDGTADTDIGGATEAAYTLAAADAGRSIKVRVTFTDDGGTEETLTSAATAVVKDSLSLSVADAQVQEEDVDATADFVVSLSRAASQTVAVDWTTVDGTATAGEDYTAASGALTFQPGETSKTVSVVILDDTVEDGGETFTLQLSNASGATLADDAATGTIRNTEGTARPDLTAAFENVPEAHDGESAFRFRVAFSEDIGIGYRSMGDDSFTVSGGAVTGARRVEGRHDLWRITVEPDSDGDLTITLPAGRECEVSGAICTRGENRRRLSNSPSATVAGPADEPEPNTPAAGAPTISGRPQVGEELTASTSDISDADGLNNASFGYQWIRTGADIGGATGSTYTPVAADKGRRLKVRVSFTDDAGNAETLTSAATDPVTAAPEPNTPAAGAPAISGTPQVNETLTASTSGISDADGLDDASFAYQWIRTDTDIQGATGSTYTPVDADEGERLTVRVSFTDNAGNEESLTSAATDAVAARPEPLTASFEGMPAEHAGQGSFSFRVAFSDGINISYKTVRDASFRVTGGDVTQASRVDRRRDLWKITIEPDSDGAVTVRLPETTDCGASGAICTGDGRPLSHSLSATVAGPVGIAVADARVEEGDGVALAFLVTLSRAASAALTVDYATADGSAHAGDDYRAASGTLTFGAGESSKTIEVGVLDDAHDEGEETLTLTLSNASSGQVTDGEATGTIKNSDPLPRALLARFGRAAAVQVVEQVEERLEASREPGFRGRLAGRELRRGMERDIGLDLIRRLGGAAGVGRGVAGVGASGAAGSMGMAGPMGGGAGSMGMAGSMDGGAGSMGMAGSMDGGAGSMGMADGGDGWLDGRGLLDMGLGGGDVLTGSAFALNRETGGGGVLSLWSRGARSRFSGREGALSLGGDVRTTMFGADYARGPLVVGLSLSDTRGLGEYSGPGAGRMLSSVTGLYPWLGYRATDRITVWGVTGYGVGGMLLTPAGGPALESGLTTAMAAAGTRGELVGGGADGFALAFKADVLWAGTAIDGVDGPEGRLVATAAGVTRVRTGLEGSRGFAFGGGGLSLRPSVEVGLRHDGGDAETGAGVDVGGGLVASHASSGLAADVRVRTLLAHEAEGFREHGVSLSLSWNPTPSTPLGLTARVAPSWGGQATSGADALWGRETMAGMGAHGGLASGNRLDGEVGYGLPVGRRFVGTPRVGFSTSEYGQDYRVGYDLGLLDRGSLNFQLGVEAQRRNSPMRGGASDGVLGRAMLGW